MPSRLRPTAAIAADAILVGDPGRALLLAQELLEQPKMSNHARGLWGYSGETAAGRALTIQATGMGGPSAAVVLGDLAKLGVRRAIRVGTCTGLAADLAAGDLILVDRGARRRRQLGGVRRRPRRGGPARPRAARATARSPRGRRPRAAGRQRRPPPGRPGRADRSGRGGRHADRRCAGQGPAAGDRRGGPADRLRGRRRRTSTTMRLRRRRNGPAAPPRAHSQPKVEG